MRINYYIRILNVLQSFFQCPWSTRKDVRDPCQNVSNIIITHQNFYPHQRCGNLLYFCLTFKKGPSRENAWTPATKALTRKRGSPKCTATYGNILYRWMVLHRHGIWMVQYMPRVEWIEEPVQCRGVSRWVNLKQAHNLGLQAKNEIATAKPVN